MLVPIRCPCGVCPQWAVVELQGTVELQQAVRDHVQSLQIGTMRCASAGKILFTIGYHELEGRLTALKKPLVILRKCQVAATAATCPVQASPSPTSPMSDIPQQYSHPQVDVKTEYHAIGVIRHKYLFKARPRALISAKMDLPPKILSFGAAPGPQHL